MWVSTIHHSYDKGLTIRVLDIAVIKVHVSSTDVQKVEVCVPLTTMKFFEQKNLFLSPGVMYVMAAS